MRRFLLLPLLLLALAPAVFLGGCRSSGELGSEPEQLVERSRATFQSLMSDTQYPALVSLVSRAKAVIIVPSLLRGAFFVGGRGGNAVMLARGADGSWSPPAFYTLGGVSFGLQFGGQASEIVIAVMTEKGLNAILERQVTLGGDAGLAVGELGKGVNAATALDLKADMYAFARSEGFFAGVSVEGSVIAPRPTWNHQFYGPEATPRGLLVDRTVTSSNEAAGALVKAMP